MQKKTIFLLLVSLCLLEAHAQIRCGNMNSPTFTAQSVSVQSGTTANATFQWTAVGATLYEVYYKLPTATQYSLACSSNSTSCTINGLLLGQTYNIRVDASRDCQIVAGEPGEDRTTVITTIALPPATPMDIGLISASITTTAFGVRWSASPGATSYRMDVSSSSSFSSGNILTDFTVTGTRQTVAGLVSGVTYYYRLRSVNALGTSGNSPVFSVTTIAPPPASLGAGSITQTSFVATWTSVPGATFYTIDVASSPNFSSGNILRDFAVFGTNLLVSGLQPRTTYYFHVRTINNGGLSINSQNFSVTTLGTPPAITSFTPVSGPVGTPVTITGSDFNTIAGNNAVFFGATRATVTAATATSLSVIAPTGATFEPIRISDITTNLTAYSARPFLLTFAPAGQTLGNNSLGPKSPFGTRKIVAVKTADLNEDGKPDMVASGGGLLSIYRNVSLRGTLDTLTFAPPLQLAVGEASHAVAIEDFNSDGKPDIVVAHDLSAISVFLNQSSPGATTFSFTKFDFNTGSQINSLATGDLDGDGRPDLALLQSIFTNGAFQGVATVLHNLGFASPFLLPGISFPAGNSPISIAIGDLDNDRKPEMVVIAASNNTVSVFKNTSVKGSITPTSFAPKIDFAAPELSNDVAIGDLDGNGFQDLAVAGFNTVSVFDNMGPYGAFNSASLAPKVDYPVNGGGLKQVTISDMNGDSRPEIIVNASVFRNNSIAGNGKSSFDPAINYLTGEESFVFDLFAGDLDNDGKSDLVTTNELKENGSANVTGYELALFHNNLASDSIPDVFVTTPVNRSTGFFPTVDIVAKSLSGASTYTIQLSPLENFSSGVFEKSGSRGQRFTDLAYGTRYFARVKTNLSPAFGKTTEFSTVLVEDLSFVVSPTNGAVDQSPNLTVSCNSVPGATQYTIELSTSPLFTTPTIIKTGNRSQSFTGLSYNTTYYSRVRTEFTQNWGETRSFTITDASKITFIINPADGAIDQPTTLNLVCTQVPGATQFTARLTAGADVLTFTSATRTIRAAGLAPNTFYQVEAKTDTSPLFGPIRTFTTAPAATIASALTAYPNPTSDQVTINNIKPGSKIKIVDAALGTIEVIDAADKQLTIETTKYRKGIYYIFQLNADGSERESLKLLVN